MSHLRKILYVLVFLVFLTGCVGSSLVQNHEMTSGKLGNFSKPPSTSRSARTICQPPSLDDCYTESQMNDYLNKVSIPDVQQFIQYSYSQMPLPQYIYIPEGMTSGSACGPQGETTYAYCPGDDTVYIGQKFEWELYSSYGAVAPVFGLAHEFGHHIQTVAHVPVPSDSPQTVNHEDQADCVAGAWVLWASQRAHIIEYPKDLTNIGELLIAISEKEGPTQTHGTVSERTGSFERGYSQGLPACNSYYPNQPIIE